jgi:hypothetical protein
MAIYRPTDVSSEELFRAIGRLRKEAQDEIDRLIGRECEHDGREPEDEGGDGAKEDDEPSLGWTLEGRAAGFDDREECDHNRPELAAARLRWHHPPAQRGNLTMLDGSPIVGNLRSMPSNVIVLDSLAVLP